MANAQIRIFPFGHLNWGLEFLISLFGFGFILSGRVTSKSKEKVYHDRKQYCSPERTTRIINQLFKAIFGGCKKSFSLGIIKKNSLSCLRMY